MIYKFYFTAARKYPIEIHDFIFIDALNLVAAKAAAKAEILTLHPDDNWEFEITGHKSYPPECSGEAAEEV